MCMLYHDLESLTTMQARIGGLIRICILCVCVCGMEAKIWACVVTIRKTPLPLFYSTV